MIYLDHAASTPARPEVITAMGPWLAAAAHPQSAHAAGRAAAAALDVAREEVAGLLGGRAAGYGPDGVVFTSGATEALMAAVFGLAHPEGALVHDATAHAAVVAACDAAVAAGRARSRRALPADGWARAVVDAAALGPRDVLVLSAACGESGVLQPVAEAIATGRPVVVDATAAAGRVPLEVSGAAAVVVSGHKLGGPQGIGALVLPGRAALAPFLPGTAERGRRGGTPFVAGAVGLGEAARRAAGAVGERATVAAWAELRDVAEGALVAAGAVVVGAGAPRVPSVCLVALPGDPPPHGDAAVAAFDLRGVCVSAGAACASGAATPSRALAAIGHPWPRSALRVSVGASSARAEVEAFAAMVPEVLGALAAEAALLRELGVVG